MGVVLGWAPFGPDGYIFKFTDVSASEMKTQRWSKSCRKRFGKCLVSSLGEAEAEGISKPDRGGLREKCPPQDIGPQLLAPFRNAVEPLGGVALLEDACHRGQSLKVYNLPHFCSLSASCVWIEM